MPPTLRRLLTSKYFLFPAGALLLYTLIGFVGLPLAISWYLPKAAHDQFSCRATLDKVRINPFRMNVEASGFSVTGLDGVPMVGFEKLFLDLDPRGLFRRTAKFSELRLDKPTLYLVVEADGKTNFSLMPSPSTATESTPSAPSRSIHILLQAFSIADGKITITDNRQSTPATVILRDLELNVKNLSSIQDQIGSFSLSTTTQEEEAIQWQGEIGLDPFRSNGKLTFSKVQMATIWGFARDTLALEPPAGTIDIQTEYRIDATSSPLQLALENFTVGLSGTALKLTETETPFFELRNFAVDSARLDLTERSIQIGKVLIDDGMLRFLVTDGGTSNLEKILRKPPDQVQQNVPSKQPEAKAQPPAPPEAPPWAIDLNAIDITNIGLHVEDRSRKLPLTAGFSSLSVSSKAKIEAGSMATKIFIQQLATEITKLQVGIKGNTDPLIAANRFFIEGGELDLGSRNLAVARVGLNDGRIAITLDEKGIVNLEQLFTAKKSANPSPPVTKTPPWHIKLPAVELKNITFDLDDSSMKTPVSYGVSNIAVSSSIDVRTGSKFNVAVKEISTELNKLRLGHKGSKNSIFEAQRFSVQGGEVDLAKRTIAIPIVELSDGNLDVVREEDGELNLAKIFSSKASTPSETVNKKKPNSNDPSWTHSIKSFTLSNFRTNFSDQTANPKAPLYQLKDLHAQVTDIDGHSPMGVDLGFVATQGGAVSFQGKVNPSPLVVDAKLDVNNLLLTPLQSYLDPYITLTLQSASISTKGTFGYGAPRTKAKIAYDGNFTLNRLRLTEPGAKEPSIAWEALQLPKISLHVEPNNLEIKEVSLNKLQGQFIIAEDRSINLAKFVKKKPAKNSAPPTSQKGSRPLPTHQKEPGKDQLDESNDSFPFTIGKVVVEDGNILFADLSMEPQFMARIHTLKGVASKISSSGDSLSEIQLTGGVDQYGYAKVTGTLDLYNIKRSAKINLNFQNVELTSVTPYSSKFAGRRINSGKLFMNLDYTIQDNQMLGNNKIIVNNLELGERVDSPEAVNLPLDLAIALLKDSSGKIDIGLPVKGDLNDPEFSLGPLVGKAFANLITKAVTAPFRALGSLFGGKAEKFNVVTFEPGKAELLPPEKEKLKKLADVLLKRPHLQLVAQGQYNAEEDGLIFKQHSVFNAVETITKGKAQDEEEPGSLDLEDSKNRRALEKIFEDRFGATALAELDRGIKEGTITGPPVETERTDQKTASQKGSLMKLVEGAKLYRLVGAKSPEQSALFTAEIYARLIESEPVSEQALLQLAAKRAQSVGAEINTVGGIPPDRIAIKSPTSPAGEEGRSVTLSLDALPHTP